MKIFSVTDPEFKPYGRVVTGLDTAKAEILAALANTPLRSIFSAACPANWAGATVTTPI